MQISFNLRVSMAVYSVQIIALCMQNGTGQIFCHVMSPIQQFMQEKAHKRAGVSSRCGNFIWSLVYERCQYKYRRSLKGFKIYILSTYMV